MHIAACFNVSIVSVWGNTIPALGMYPYYPNHSEKYSMHQVEGLSCRPCSKIGFQTCPKKHFNCMHLQNTVAIAEDLVLRSEISN
jgi:ADP-heptose:LPS heptosyltransferase